MSQFNVSSVVDAIVQSATANGAFVRAIVEAREACPKFNAEKVSVSIAEMLAARVNAGEIEVQSARNYVSYARAMLECKLPTLIAACEDGYGITGVLSRIRAVEGTRSKAGRPAGKGKGKTTKKADAADDAVAESPNLATRDGAIAVLQEIMAKRTKLVPAVAHAALADALTAALVIIRNNKL